MKVWLVWEGEYSDKDVIGVFGDEHVAEVYASRVDDGCYITEHEISKIEYDKCINICYTIKICYCDNNFQWESVKAYSAYKVGKNRQKLNDVILNEYPHVTYYYVTVVAKSKDEAFKKANDLVAKYRAEKAGL